MILGKFVHRYRNEDDDTVTTLNISDGGGDSGTVVSPRPNLGEIIDRDPGENEPGADRGDVVIDPDAPTATPAPSPSPAPAPAAPVPPAPPAPSPSPAPAPAGDDTTEGASGNAIPHARFAEVNERRKAAEAEAERLRAENEALRRAAQPPAATAPPTPTPPPAPAFDVRAQERAYAEAMADGDFDKAVGIRDSINAHILQQATAQAEANVTARQQQQQVATTLQQTSDAILQQHPWLDTAEGELALSLIVADRDRRIASGETPAAALRAAADAIAPKFAPAGAAAAPATALPQAQPPKDTRPAAAAARGAQAATQQPVPLHTGGMGNDPAKVIRVADLTEEQFEALTPAQKRQMRGD